MDSKLKKLVDEAEILKSKNITSTSPEFQAWKNKATRYLIKNFGEESYEAVEFQKIRYSPMIIGDRNSQSDLVNAFNNGIGRAKAILETYLEENEEIEMLESSVDALKKLQYEFNGIRDVILDYTDSGVVNNFLNGLENGIKKNDKEKIKYFLSEIYSWYKQNLEKIAANEYVNNLEEHERNRDIIEEVLSKIDSSDFSNNQEMISVIGMQEPIIFLSHSSSDRKYGDAFEKLFSSMGIKNEQLIYTSHPLHKIPLNINIYDYLKESFGKRIFVIILWSDDYLESPACLNEMGAAWVTQSDYTNVYVPSFDFRNPKYYKCAVDRNRMGAILDGSENCKAGIIELKNKLVELFDLDIDEKQWTYSLDQFMKEIS